MSDTWKDLQEIKSRQLTFREKLQKRKREREGLLGLATTTTTTTQSSNGTEGLATTTAATHSSDGTIEKESAAPEVELQLLRCLCAAALTDSRQLAASVSKILAHDVSHHQITNLLQKFAVQELISVKETSTPEGEMYLSIISAEHSKLDAVTAALEGVTKQTEPKSKHQDINTLLSQATTKQKQSKKLGEEIYDLLSTPTAMEKSLAERFRSQGGAQVQEFCPAGTKADCMRTNNTTRPCSRLHFKKIIQSHTDESLGDCSFLNTCFHIDVCKFVHYEVDTSVSTSGKENARPDKLVSSLHETHILFKAQWIQCDLRFFDMSVLGKYAVVMADPPWDIHMELPYGTLSDDEMRALGVPCLQDDGLIFLWVTGRAMELGRECLSLWGYDRVDEIIWVKTNQLQRIIRTGRTGHWLNHGKEHCLVGKKGNPAINRGLDCDVIVAEVRATSHKPDEIYGIIERLSPGTRKIELFGRQHNVQPNWITLGNQLEGVHLLDPELITNFKKRYPDGNCMVPPEG